MMNSTRPGRIPSEETNQIMDSLKEFREGALMWGPRAFPKTQFTHIL